MTSGLSASLAYCIGRSLVIAFRSKNDIFEIIFVVVRHVFVELENFMILSMMPPHRRSKQPKFWSTLFTYFAAGILAH